MKKTIMLGYTPQTLYDRLWKELNKIYIGKGLFIEIESISLIEPKIKTHEADEDILLNICEIRGTYGRLEEDDYSNNFAQNFKIEFGEDDSLDYIAGKFAQIIDVV